MILCKICNKNIRKNNINTLLSVDTAGNMFVNYICNDCLKDKDKVEGLMNDVDKQLIEKRKRNYVY